MSWLDLKGEVADMFSILEVPVLFEERHDRDKRFSSEFLVLNPEKQREYQAEYRSRPENKARKAKLAKAYWQRADVKLRRNARQNAARAAKRAELRNEC